MKCFYPCFYLLLGIGGVASNSTGPAKLFSPAELQQDLGFMYAQMQAIRPSLFAYCDKALADRDFLKLRTSINKSMSRQ